jgi:hypothetical protein
MPVDAGMRARQWQAAMRAAMHVAMRARQWQAAMHAAMHARGSGRRPCMRATAAGGRVLPDSHVDSGSGADCNSVLPAVQVLEQASFIKGALKQAVRDCLDKALLVQHGHQVAMGVNNGQPASRAAHAQTGSRANRAIQLHDALRAALRPHNTAIYQHLPKHRAICSQRKAKVRGQADACHRLLLCTGIHAWLAFHALRLDGSASRSHG